MVLVGAAGAGKSTLAERWFADAEILSSDRLRGQISGDPADQSVSRAAFAILHRQLAARLDRGATSVVDATNLDPRGRRALIRYAAAAGTPATAIVLDLPATLVLARNAGRADRVVPEAVVLRQLARLRRIMADDRLRSEGFDRVVRITDPDAVDALRIVRVAASGER